MATTNHERVGKALDLLRDGLAPFVEREVKDKLRDQAIRLESLRRFAEDPRLADKPIAEWDASGLLKLMWGTWNDVFRYILGHTDRSMVSELRDWRNKWAHQERFSSEDAERALDSTQRLLAAVSAPEADEVDKMRKELRRLVMDEQTRSEKRRASLSLSEAASDSALPAWRDVITPHTDVATGRYQQAEFAADLWQVHIGEGSDEYRDPREFFRRTFLTGSLKQLLTGAVQRLAGQDGDPVVQLQTNFGGGKTHSMLALYHLFSGTSPGELAGMDEVLAAAGVKSPAEVRRVVLVGNKLSPGRPEVKPDGTEVRTLWGELAYQLGGKEAFEQLRADDENSTSPGDVLRNVLDQYGPALILIDEWVSYARQLHEESDLPGGSFDTQFTFAQTLTESVKGTHNCLLVVSLPASDQGMEGSPHAQAEDEEVGGLKGREALTRLRNVVARVESSWRPASAEEGFEIVRRRLFEPPPDEDAYKQRDVVARAFVDYYQAQRGEFPSECQTSDYERRIQASYPIHPEVFDRLYQDWSTLPRFQRTRGVLRLMAAVIHSLWQGGDGSALILPSTIPIDDPRVQSELTRYLPDNWTPVIESDVDGPNSLPLKIDAETPNLGKANATQRVARTVYLGSAPIMTAAHRGIDHGRVRLGCAKPGQTPALFGDALRRLAATATYLYQDDARVWYDTQPTVTRLAEDRAEELRRKPDEAHRELEKRLRENLKIRGDFPRVHPLPASGADVPDEADAGLVVLAAEHAYSKGQENKALEEAQAILESRGNAPRQYRNTLVFLAADSARYQDLDEALRRYLAWRSVVENKDDLNLDPHQARQAETQRKAADDVVETRLPETYQCLLVPGQGDPQAKMSWKEIRLTGGGGLAERAAKRLRNDQLLVASLGAAILRIHMDRVPLWRGENHVSIRQLVEDFSSYLYLPRLRDPQVLMNAIQAGVTTLTWKEDSFAYAEDYDEAKERYRGLVAGRQIPGSILPESTALLVKPEAASRQIEAEAASPDATPGSPDGGASPDAPPPLDLSGSGAAAPVPDAGQPAPEAKAKRYHGTVVLDTMRVGADAGRIADEVISHLSSLDQSEVTVTLEITAIIPDGVPDNTKRTVTENSRTLGFTTHDFEDS